MEIRNMVHQLQRHPSKKYKKRKLSDIEHLVIHHTGAPETVGPFRIARFHVENGDWPGAGYHYLVSADGFVMALNLLETVSYHVYEQNTRCVGIALCGSFRKGHEPAIAQLDATAQLCATLCRELGLSWRDIVGHKELVNTICPGDTWNTAGGWKEPLLFRVRKAL